MGGVENCLFGACSHSKSAVERVVLQSSRITLLKTTVPSENSSVDFAVYCLLAFMTLDGSKACSAPKDDTKCCPSAVKSRVDAYWLKQA